MYNRNNQSTGISTAVISKNQLDRIQRSIQPVVETKEACTNAERKQRILKYEELRRKELSKLSEFQLEEIENAKKINDRATKIKMQDHEKAREMNSKITYIKCVYKRDEQLKRKAEEEEILKKEAKEWHTLTMKDREKHFEEERLKKVNRHHRIMEGAKIIRQQLAEREHQHIIEKEQVAKEGDIIIQNIKLLEEEQKQKEIQKEQLRKQMQAEISKSNEEATRIKKMKKQKEREEDDKIARYNKQKCIREEALEKQKEEEHHRKEIEAAQLRAKQEKIMDNRGQLDEIRARRYKEQGERQWRKQELEKAKKKAARDEELLQVRKTQLELKEARLAKQIEQDKREHAVMMQQLKKYEKQNEIKHDKDMKNRHDYHSQLINQIETKREEKKRKELLEQKVTRNKFESERKVLVQMKQQKLEELRASGIPEKYLYDLQNVRI